MCPKSQVNCQWNTNYFVEMSLYPSNSRPGITCKWTLIEFTFIVFYENNKVPNKSTVVLDCRGLCDCSSITVDLL